MMKNRRRFPMFVITFTVCCTLLGTPASAAAQSTGSPFGTISIDSGAYTFQNNEWNSSAQQCATVSGTGFRLTTADFNLPTNGAPATYPSIFKGCHWGNCTTNSGMPVEGSQIGSALSSWSTPLPPGPSDVAYDIWFNKPRTPPGQPRGAELMIWIDRGATPQPAGS